VGNRVTFRVAGVVIVDSSSVPVAIVFQPIVICIVGALGVVDLVGSIGECGCDRSACLLPTRDNAIGGNEVIWQTERIRNAAVGCNTDNYISTPRLIDIIVHNDANIRIALPVRSGERDGRTGGIIRLVTGYRWCCVLRKGCSNSVEL